MPENIVDDSREANESDLIGPAREAFGSDRATESGYRNQIAILQRQLFCLKIALGASSEGVCCFDQSGHLVFSNSRYAEMYRLDPESLRIGSTSTEIARMRSAAGTEFAEPAVKLPADPRRHSASSQAALRDGRTIRICRRSIPDGGWIELHQTVPELRGAQAIACERESQQTLIDWVPAILWVKDVNSRFVIANKAAAKKIGRTDPEDLIGKDDFELHPHETAQQYITDEQKIMQSGAPMVDKEEYVFDASGAKTWISTTKAPLRNEKNEIFGLVGISFDITDRRRADLLRDSQAKILEMIASSAPLESVLDRLVRLVESQLLGVFGSVLLLDGAGRLRHCTAPGLAATYVKAVDGAGITPHAGSGGSATEPDGTVVAAEVEREPPWNDLRELAISHGYRSCWPTPILSPRGEMLGVFSMYSDSLREPTSAETRIIDVAVHIAAIAIERKKAEERIQHIAHHDALTGLPNRSLLNDRLAQAISHAQRHDRWVAVVFVDLDNFKLVNDSLGHDAGDNLLKTVAKRMLDGVRASDTVARLGGDEFVVVLCDQAKNVGIILAVLQKIKAAISEPIQFSSHEFRVTSSFGVAIYPRDGIDASTLLTNADAAMYRVKEVGRNNLQFYTPELNATADE